MDINSLSLTYIGGPTAVLEIAGLRFLTDPTFDPAGSDYTTPGYTLHKTAGPAIPASDIGRIDAVLGGNAVGLGNWESVELASPSGTTLRVTGTPARHGPAGGDRGPVTGFLIADSSAPTCGSLCFLGAAKVREVGPAHLTFVAAEGVEAQYFAHAHRVSVTCSTENAG